MRCRFLNVPPRNPAARQGPMPQAAAGEPAAPPSVHPVRRRAAPRAALSLWHAAAPLVAALLLSAVLAPARALAQEDLDYWQVLALDRAAFRVRSVALLPVVSGERGQRLVYGDRFGFVHVVQLTGRDAHELARSRPLDGAVLEVRTEDLDGDGRVEIVARLTGGRLYIFDDQLNLHWENLPEDYDEITAFTIANVDNDPAYELVILGDGYLDYIDGSRFNREFRSTTTYQATEIEVGNVDSDATLEIVLNTGTVLDAVTGEPKWRTDAFGQNIELLDIDGDGIEEILGYTPGSPMRIFEADRRQEKRALE
jgi:hypothetical protein